MESYINHFIDTLTDYMSANNLSVKEFSKKIDCDNSCVIKWFNGYNQPSLEYVIMVADKLDISVDYLLGLSESADKLKVNSIATFQDRIQSFINKTNINKNKLAAICGITSSTVSKWILRKQLPKPDTAVKLATFFGCSLDYLLARTDLM